MEGGGWERYQNLGRQMDFDSNIILNSISTKILNGGCKGSGPHRPRY
jgi:hypothetical protein